MVKVAKETLKAIVGNAGLTNDELQTAIKEVEALMNLRPLMYQGADSWDEPVLTPNLFLVGQLGGQLAPQATDDIAFNPRNHWRLIQNLVRVFWKCWREEYLSTLNMQKKWREAKKNLKVRDVVLVVDQNAPRGQWRLGWVDQVFPDQDRHVRIIQVSTRAQKFIRLITRLCLLNVAGQPEYMPWREGLRIRRRSLGGGGMDTRLFVCFCKCQVLPPVWGLKRIIKLWVVSTSKCLKCVLNHDPDRISHA